MQNIIAKKKPVKIKYLKHSIPLGCSGLEI